MARKITISLTDALESQIQAEAQARGSPSVEECAAAMLQEHLQELQQVRTDDEALKAELRKGLAGPGHSWTEADRDRDKAELAARRLRSKAG